MLQAMRVENYSEPVKRKNKAGEDEVILAPSGGLVRATGIAIDWQNGPRVGAHGQVMEPNGAFVETVIAAARQRLAYFQGSVFVCEENRLAIELLDDALLMLESRSKRRVAAGIEGTHGIDPKKEGAAIAPNVPPPPPIEEVPEQPAAEPAGDVASREIKTRNPFAK